MTMTPWTPLTLLETKNRQLAISEVWRAPSRAHTLRQLVFPPHPCQPTPAAAAVRVYLKPSRASRFAVRGQPPPWQLAVAPSCQCRGNLHSVSLGPGLAVKDGGGRGEGGNQLFRPRSQRGEGEKGEAFEESSEQSRVEFRGWESS